MSLISITLLAQDILLFISEQFCFVFNSTDLLLLTVGARVYSSGEVVSCVMQQHNSPLIDTAFKRVHWTWTIKIYQIQAQAKKIF